jgi:hypothetical protein
MGYIAVFQIAIIFKDPKIFLGPLVDAIQPIR